MDNINVKPSESSIAVAVATDEISNTHYPIYKTAYGSDGEVTNVSQNTPLPVSMGNNDLVLDAWGRQKVIHDYSLFHGVWTYDVPNRIWEEQSVDSDGDWTPLTATGTNVTSSGGMLNINSGTTANNGAAVVSKRHPRYQPNRGHLYSTAIICPNAEYDGIRRWGIFCNCTGVYFELEGDGSDWTLYACRRTVPDADPIRMEITDLPSGFDPNKGHVYDIQHQWRGVGNYMFYIDLQLVYTCNLLGTLTALSVQNPANPITFECITHTTTALTLKSGCVDVTSEGGKATGRSFLSISTGNTLLQADATGRAMIGIYVPRTVSYEGNDIANTRDLVASKIAAWCRDESATQVYFARDVVATNLAGLTWSSFLDSNTQYLVGGETSNLDTAFQTDRGNMQLVISEWVDAEQKNIITNPTEQAATFYITPGDILIIAVMSYAGDDDSAVTLYLSEEI